MNSIGVCLDAACGRPWREVVRAPAVRHLPLATLARAVAVADGIRANPALLRGLNTDSLAMRGRAAVRSNLS